MNIDICHGSLIRAEFIATIRKLIHIDNLFDGERNRDAIIPTLRNMIDSTSEPKKLGVMGRVPNAASREPRF